MTWAAGAGTQTITFQHNCMRIVSTVFDSANETDTVIEFDDHADKFGGKLPKGKNISMSVVQTAGTTNTLAISFQGANDGVQYRDVVDIVACEQGAAVGTFSGCVAASELYDAVLTHGRIYMTTRGGTNVITATVMINYDDR